MMKPHIYPENLDISRIDFTDFSYSITPARTGKPDESLTESIARHGILHPPIVKRTTQNKFGIVTGRKRLQAFSALFPEKKTCTCMVIPEPVSEVDVFSLLLAETRGKRQLSPVEKAVFLSKTSSLMNDKQAAKEFLPLLDLPPDPAHIRKMVSLLELEEPLISALHRGTLNEAVARDMVPLSGKDRAAVFQIISSLHLSVSYQKKLLNICRELASRENKSIAVILEDKSIQEIIRHKGANPPQITKNLMNRLSRKYLPRSSKADDEFRQFVAALQLPRNASVDHTPFFEDDAVTLSISFSNRKIFQNAWENIKDALDDAEN